MLEELKEKIARIEGRTQRFTAVDDASAADRWTLGVASLDAALPDGALPFATCHDFTPETKTDVVPTAGFIVSLLKRLPRHGPIVWCQTAYNAREYGRLYAPGLMDSGLTPDRLLFVTVPKPRDLALVLEETVRVSKVAAVIGEGPAPDFTASRRLVLAAQESRVPCLTLNTSGEIGASAATTRWRVAPIAGPPDPLDPQGPGFPAWSLTLSRSRNGRADLNPTMKKPLDIFFDHATHSFHLVPAFRHRALLAHDATAGAL